MSGKLKKIIETKMMICRFHLVNHEEPREGKKQEIRKESVHNRFTDVTVAVRDFYVK